MQCSNQSRGSLLERGITMLEPSMKSILLVAMFCLPFAADSAQNKKENTPKSAQSISELRLQLGENP
jgi:hypothetical protein